MSIHHLNELVLGKLRVTADPAPRLAHRFDTTLQLWIHLRADGNLHPAQRKGSAA